VVGTDAGSASTAALKFAFDLAFGSPTSAPWTTPLSAEMTAKAFGQTLQRKGFEAYPQSGKRLRKGLTLTDGCTSP
jgi:hypothetical protein